MGKVVSQAIWSLLQKILIVLISVGPAGFRFHLERYEHAKDRRLMGLMWNPESDGQSTSRLTVKPRKSLSFSQYRGITDTMLALLTYLFIYVLLADVYIATPVGGVKWLSLWVIHDSFMQSTDPFKMQIRSGKTLETLESLNLSQNCKKYLNL